MKKQKIKITVFILFLFQILIFQNVYGEGKSTQAENESSEQESKFSPTPPQVNGLLQVWATKGMQNLSTSTFNMRRMELKVSGDLVKGKLGYVAMIDPISKTVLVNETGGSNKIINVAQDLFFTYTFSKKAKVTFGQFLYPITREGLAPTEYLHFAERSAVGSVVGDKRDIGVQLSGDISFVNYAIAVINGNGQDFIDDNQQKDFASRIVFKPISSLEFGGSIYFGTAKLNESNVKKQRFAVELEFSQNNWGLIGEFARKVDGTFKAQGYYGTFYYKVKSNIEAAVRFEQWDTDIDLGNKTQNIFSFGAGYYLFNNHLKLLLNYTLINQNEMKATGEVIGGVQIAF